MIVDKFETPVGVFRVYKNSEVCSFIVEKGKYNTFWLEDNIEVHPEGCYKILIDLINFLKGDTILCEPQNVELVNDGGGENSLNIVGNVDNYVIGIGAADTESIEYGYNKDDLPIGVNKTKYYLPYDTVDINKGGYIFEVKDNPIEYRDIYNRKYIELSLVWERNENKYAWEIVSYLTS